MFFITAFFFKWDFSFIFYFAVRFTSSAIYVFHLKGIVHPKIKMLSSFAHPHVVPNLYDLIFVAKHNILTFWNMLLWFDFGLTSIV